MEQIGLENIWLKKIGVEIIESNRHRNNWLGKEINIFFCIWRIQFDWTLAEIEWQMIDSDEKVGKDLIIKGWND